MFHFILSHVSFSDGVSMRMCVQALESLGAAVGFAESHAEFFIITCSIIISFIFIHVVIQNFEYAYLNLYTL